MPNLVDGKAVLAVLQSEVENSPSSLYRKAAHIVALHIATPVSVMTDPFPAQGLGHHCSSCSTI